MRPYILILAGLTLVLAVVAVDTMAQQAAGETTTPAADVRLVYEREIFTYQPTGRRDPFRPLTDDDEMGPRFEQLSLRAIIYSTGVERSVAMLADGSGRVYRVRVGDVIGNARVTEIGPMRVVMAVETFGTIRQEMLELQRRGGAQP